MDESVGSGGAALEVRASDEDVRLSARLADGLELTVLRPERKNVSAVDPAGVDRQSAAYRQMIAGAP